MNIAIYIVTYMAIAIYCVVSQFYLKNDCMVSDSLDCYAGNQINKGSWSALKLLSYFSYPVNLEPHTTFGLDFYITGVQ